MWSTSYLSSNNEKQILRGLHLVPPCLIWTHRPYLFYFLTSPHLHFFSKRRDYNARDFPPLLQPTQKLLLLTPRFDSTATPLFPSNLHLFLPPGSYCYRYIPSNLNQPPVLDLLLHVYLYVVCIYIPVYMHERGREKLEVYKAQKSCSGKRKKNTAALQKN